MPTKISIAMSEEIGSPECESLGVTCSLEFDDDSPALQNLETFQLAVHSAAHRLPPSPTRGSGLDQVASRRRWLAPRRRLFLRPSRSQFGC